MFTKTVALSLLSAIAYALPSGSPFCQIDRNTMEEFVKHHSAGSKTTGFSADFTKENGSYKINLSKKDTPVHGVLMYVTGDDKSRHLGSFKSKTAFKFVTGEQCGGADSTITHADGNEKTDTEFIWTPGQNDEGPYTLHAVVSGDKNPWTMLEVKEQAAVKPEPAPAAPAKEIDPYASSLPYFGGVQKTEEPVEEEEPIEEEEEKPIEEVKPTYSSSEGIYKPLPATATATVDSIYLNGEASKGPMLIMAAFTLFAVLA